MKRRQNLSSKLSEAETRAYLKEIAERFSGKIFFPEKLERARETLKKVTFPPQTKTNS